uniref:Uncharacterized protein n=1 Tax=Caenorhabditis tropicalis TaxID=1561998 RepID=A0A1I7TKR5_9PELO
MFNNKEEKHRQRLVVLSVRKFSDKQIRMKYFLKINEKLSSFPIENQSRFAIFYFFQYFEYYIANIVIDKRNTYIQLMNQLF